MSPSLKFSDLARVLLYLFPLPALLVGAYFFQGTVPDLGAPVPSYWLMQNWAPFLLWDAPKLAITTVTGILTLPLLFYCPERWRKAYVAAVLTAYLLAVLRWETVLVAGFGTTVLWASIISKNPFLRRTGVMFAIAILYLGFHHFDPSEWLVWGLFTQILAGAYSTCRDHENAAEPPDFFDSWNLWLGIPCGFLAILYSHREFMQSFFARPYPLIARDGITRIYLGLSKLLAVCAVEILLYPRISFTKATLSAVVRAEAGLSLGEKFWISFVLLASFIVSYTGVIQVIQGITRLFGYDVSDQVRQPWKSKSLLDFWQRGTYHTRRYLLRYVFFPVFLRSRHLYLSLLAVWVLEAAKVSVWRGGLVFEHLKPMGQLDVWLSSLTKFGIIFAGVSYLELRWPSPRPNGARKLLSWSLLVFALFLGNEVWPEGHVYFWDNLRSILLVLVP